MGYPKIDFLYLSEDDMIAAGVKTEKLCRSDGRNV